MVAQIISWIWRWSSKIPLSKETIITGYVLRQVIANLLIANMSCICHNWACAGLIQVALVHHWHGSGTLRHVYMDGMVVHPDQLHKWLCLGHALVMFLIGIHFLVIHVKFVLHVIFLEHIEELVSNLAWYCVLTIFRTDQILAILCWFSQFWCNFTWWNRAKLGLHFLMKGTS